MDNEARGRRDRMRARTVAVAGAFCVALAGCHAVQPIDLVNTCETPITVFGGVDDPSAGTTVNMVELAPHATAASYALDSASAVFYIRAEGEDAWRGPVVVSPPAGHADPYRYELPLQWCESDT